MRALTGRRRGPAFWRIVAVCLLLAWGTAAGTRPASASGGVPPARPGSRGSRSAASTDALPPPTLLRPFDGGTVTDPTVVWSWFFQPRTAAGAPVVYDLHVAEVLPHQSPEEALRLNPLVINRVGLSASVWQTAQAVEGLHPGSTYAWQLVARGGSAVNVSEIRTFLYQGPNPEPARSSLPAAAPATSASPPSSQNAGGNPGASTEASGPPAGSAEANPPLPEASGASPSTGTETSPASAAAGSASAAPGVRLRTTSRLHAESTNHIGFLSQQPEHFGRMEIDPTLDLYGSPLSLSLLLSTEKNARSSELDRGSIGMASTGNGLGFAIQQRIDQRIETEEKTELEARADSLRSQMHDTSAAREEIRTLASLRQAPPTETIHELEERKLLTPAEATLLQIPQFGFGSVVPDYDRYLLTGTTVNGGMVEYSRSRIYTAVVVGKAQRLDPEVNLLPSAINGSTDTPDLYRNLYAARLGYGQRDGSNLIASVLYARDDAQSRSILRLAGTGAGTLVPQQNTVAGLSGRLAAAPGGPVVEGEINASVIDHSQTAVNTENRPPYRFLRGLFGSGQIHRDSAVDWSGALRGSVPLAVLAGRVTSGLRFVGPGYESLGTTDLRKDVLRYDAAYDLESGHLVSLALRYAYDRIGVVLPELGESRVETFSINSGIHPPGFPEITVAFDRNHDVQRADTAAVATLDRSDQITLQTEHWARAGGWTSETLVTLTRVLGTSVDSTGEHSSTNVGLGEKLSLPVPLNILAHLGYTHTHTRVSDGPEPELWTGDLTLVHDLGRYLQASMGASRNGSAFARGRGFFLGASWAMTAAMRAELQWDYDDYRDDVVPARGYIERKLRFNLYVNS